MGTPRINGRTPRGIGKTQQRILDALAFRSVLLWPPMSVRELSEELGISDRQVRQAVRALERRFLVVITKETVGWKGKDEDGSPVYIAHTPLIHWRGFMPIYGLLVWQPEARARWEEGQAHELASFIRRNYGMRTFEILADERH